MVAVEPTCESVGRYGGAVLVLELGLHEQILRQTNCIVPIHPAHATHLMQRLLRKHQTGFNSI